LIYAVAVSQSAASVLSYAITVSASVTGVSRHGGSGFGHLTPVSSLCSLGAEQQFTPE
jgi:hypothetical protein